MMRILLPGDADYAERVRALTERQAAVPPEVAERAREIVSDVRARGDAAVREWTLRLEQRELPTFEVPRIDWERAARALPADVLRAIERAGGRIRAFHERWREQGFETSEPGIRLGLRVEPLARVGLYAPGGTARYPSTVLMTALPARVAGVEEIVLTTPGPSPETLAAARVAGVDRVLALGGAQAVAALAYGTESVPRVDKIVGPGNLYVAAAKRIVFGDVAIDSIAGPSEILILADDAADPRAVAADLLAQAEHDTAAYPVLVTPSDVLAAAVVREVEKQLASLPRREIAQGALAAHGTCVVTAGLSAALEFANAFAPEHLELMVRDPRALWPQVKTAGACFLGGYTPEPVGDYFAGPNHVLPTGGSARWSSPLGCWDFVRRSTMIEYDRAALAAQAGDISRLAKVEGLQAHARAVAIRFEEP
ncbi:MAG TPA: histidinol dehydrogenase [Polyangia bacterium]|nr:histidinol dehydrogenase [Polyangia bacterium]